MRLLRVVLFVALPLALVGTGGVASAGSKIPLRVVRTMPETHQALLYDRTQGTHVLVEQGKTIDGYLVEDIDDDEVTLVGDAGAEIVLAGPDWHHRRDDRADRADRDDRDDKGAKKSDAKPAPQDPYAPASPQDPYAEPAGDGAVRTAEAPTASSRATPGAIRVAEAPGASTATASIAAPAVATPATAFVVATATAAPATATPATATPATATPATATPATAAPATAAAAAAAAPSAPSAAWSDAGSTPVPVPPVAAAPSLTRADVAGALANFGKLAGSVHGAFTADGARLDAIAPDSLFARAGLRNGDVITAVDAQPLRSLDDAATLYARASALKSATSLTLSVVRADKPLTLRVVIQ